MNNSSQSRLTFIDKARGLLMALVVIGHADAPVARFIGLFHVAAFFFLSGYLLPQDQTTRTGEFILKRTKRLYIPYIVYGCLFVVVHNVFVNWNVYHPEIPFAGVSEQIYKREEFIRAFVNVLLMNRTELLLGGFWFLKSLYLASLAHMLLYFGALKIFPGTVKLHAPSIAIVGLFCLFAMQLTTIIVLPVQLPVTVSRTFVVLLFIHAGYLFRRYERIIPVKLEYAVAACCWLLWASVQGAVVSIASNKYSSVMQLVLCGLSGAYLVFFLAKRSWGWLDSVFLLIGRQTIPILALHFLSFKAVSLGIVYFYNKPIQELAHFPTIPNMTHYWPVYTFVGIFFPLCISTFTARMIFVMKSLYEKSMNS